MKKFKCAKCGGVFEKIITEEEAEKEMLEIWGNIPEEERIIICDNCFKSIPLEEMKKNGEEYKNKQK